MDAKYIIMQPDTFLHRFTWHADDPKMFLFLFHEMLCNITQQLINQIDRLDSIHEN